MRSIGLDDNRGGFRIAHGDRGRAGVFDFDRLLLQIRGDFENRGRQTGILDFKNRAWSRRGIATSLSSARRLRTSIPPVLPRFPGAHRL